jgi:MFS family permease
MSSKELISSDQFLDKTKQSSSEDIINIDSKIRIKLFLILLLIFTISSADGGIIPYSTNTIKKELNISDTKIGIYSSLDFFGRVFGSIIISLFITHNNRKKLLLFALINKGIFLCISLVTINCFINFLARFLTGVFQVFFTIYFPVWCDQYGNYKKTEWVTIMQIGSPIGIIFGYGFSMCLSILFKNLSEWRLAYLFEGGSLIIIGFYIDKYIDEIYFSEKFVLLSDNSGKYIEIKKDEKKKFKDNLFIIITNKVFLFNTISGSVAFFGLGVIQFWGNDYLKNYLEVKNNGALFIFNILSISGPTLGVAFGGYLISKIGGYSKIEANYIPIFFSFLSGIFGLSVGFTNKLFIYFIVSWIYYFSLGAMLPSESGIILDSLSEKLKGDGFTITNFLLNLLGNCPSPFIFPLIKEKIFKNDNDKDKWSHTLTFTMTYNLVGTICVCLGAFYRYKIKTYENLDENIEIPMKKNNSSKLLLGNNINLTEEEM